jgi:hypothetical protein
MNWERSAAERCNPDMRARGLPAALAEPLRRGDVRQFVLTLEGAFVATTYQMLTSPPEQSEDMLSLHCAALHSALEAMLVAQRAVGSSAGGETGTLLMSTLLAWVAFFRVSCAVVGVVVVVAAVTCLHN